MTDLLPELAVGTAETMRRALDRPRTNGLSSLERKDLVRHSVHLLRLIKDAWRACRKRLGEGVEATTFQRDCERMTAVLDDFLDSLPRVRQLIQEQPRTGGRSSQLARLGRVEEEAHDIRKAFRGWLATFSLPPRPIDWAVVAEAEAAHARGEHRTIDQILAGRGRVENS